MYTQQISSLYTPTTQTTTSQQSLGKQEFLQLLVAQLKNQDPLSPLESQEFASQLAQFTSVETLTSIDENIQESSNTDLLLMQSIQNTMAASFIGKEVTAQMDDVYMETGKDTTLLYKLNSDAATVTVTVRNSAGKVVRTIVNNTLPAGENTVEWDGKDDNGNALASGKYTFSVAAEDDSGDAITATALFRAVISSVRYESGAAVLIAGGLEVAFADVMQISAAEWEGK